MSVLKYLKLYECFFKLKTIAFKPLHPPTLHKNRRRQWRQETFTNHRRRPSWLRCLWLHIRVHVLNHLQRFFFLLFIPYQSYFRNQVDLLFVHSLGLCKNGSFRAKGDRRFVWEIWMVVRQSYIWRGILRAAGYGLVSIAAYNYGKCALCIPYNRINASIWLQ